MKTVLMQKPIGLVGGVDACKSPIANSHAWSVSYFCSSYQWLLLLLLQSWVQLSLVIINIVSYHSDTNETRS